jgi:leader peptidase (prepilin peptidase)/N-methyltransferase
VSPALPLPLLVGLVGSLGLAVGSFLNVVVHRVPLGLSVVSPGSACPACGHEVRGRDNVPVLSWVLLRGRCRDCRAPIPARYPLVEAGTALLMVAVALRVDDPEVLGAALVVAAAGVALALIDLEHGRLPFALTGVAAVPVVGLLALDQARGAAVPVSSLAVAVAAWAGVYAGCWALTRGRGMGLGDVALAPVLVLAVGGLGVGSALVGLGAGFVLGGLVAGVLLATGRVARGDRVPHGPFMLVGAGVGLFVGEPVAAAYLRLTGLA